MGFQYGQITRGGGWKIHLLVNCLDCSARLSPLPSELSHCLGTKDGCALESVSASISYIRKEIGR